MALDVWYKSDIQNALSAAKQSSAAAWQAAGVEGDAYAIGFQAGYHAALVTLALAFGIAPAWTRMDRRSILPWGDRLPKAKAPEMEPA